MFKDSNQCQFYISLCHKLIFIFIVYISVHFYILSLTFIYFFIFIHFICITSVLCLHKYCFSSVKEHSSKSLIVFGSLNNALTDVRGMDGVSLPSVQTN